MHLQNQPYLILMKLAARSELRLDCSRAPRDDREPDRPALGSGPYLRLTGISASHVK